MATITPAVAARKLEDVRIIVVTPWSRQIAGISYNDVFVHADTCCSTRVAIEQFCGAETLARLQLFVQSRGGPSLWVLERAAKFEGLFWIDNFRNNAWQIQGCRPNSWDDAVNSLINELTAGHLQSHRLCSQMSAVADREHLPDFCCATAVHWCNTCKLFFCTNHNVQGAFTYRANRPGCLTCGSPLFTLCASNTQHAGKVYCFVCNSRVIEIESLDAHLESESHGGHLAMGPPWYMSPSRFRGRGTD